MLFVIMASLVLTITFATICISSMWLMSVNASRADLGSYLHIKEMPSAEEKLALDSYVLAFINYTYSYPDGKRVHFSEEKARYGEGKILNVQGLLVHVTAESDANDHTACNPPLRGTGGVPLPGLGKPWVALIKRGLCTFEEKIKYAWRQGAVGVIVYNEEASVSLEKMKIIEKDRNITAVFTYKSVGEDLARLVEEGKAVWISISEGHRGRRPLVNINKTSVLFVSISFIVLMTISLVWLVFYYVQRFRYLQSKDQHSRHLCTVAKRIIMKIPTKSGKCEDKDCENDCCAICIELYKPTDCIRILPCNHEFHKNCIDPWLLEHRTCPMCKLDVLKHYGFVVGDPSQKMSSAFQNFQEQNNRNRSNNSHRLNSALVSNNIGDNIIDPSFARQGSSSSSFNVDLNRMNSHRVTASRQVTDV